MAVPKNIFIDTSILDGCSYNFESAAVQPLIEIAKSTPLTLLLPEPTEREIRRHIKERSDEVLAALVKAQQRAPFLKKWKDWPLKSNHEFFLARQLNRMATIELDSFFALFEVMRLGPKHIDIAEIMEWQDKGKAPFGKGNKKAEFPDALALSTLLSFADLEDQAIAVISKDGDFRGACSFHDRLFYYPSLGSYVESLLLSDEHVRKVRDILDKDVEMIAEGVSDEFVGLSFYPTDDETAKLEHAEVDDVDFLEVNIVGAGEKEASVSFQADVFFSISAIIENTDWEGPVSHTEFLSESSTLTGFAKLSVNDDWTEFTELTLLRLDEDDIGVEARKNIWDIW